MAPVFDGRVIRVEESRLTMFERHTVQAKTISQKVKTPATHEGVPGLTASIDAPSARLSLGQVASPQSLPPFHRATLIVNQFDVQLKRGQFR
jgi:hypothetical protein